MNEKAPHRRNGSEELFLCPALYRDFRSVVKHECNMSVFVYDAFLHHDLPDGVVQCRALAPYLSNPEEVHYNHMSY